MVEEVGSGETSPLAHREWYGPLCCCLLLFKRRSAILPAAWSRLIFHSKIHHPIGTTDTVPDFVRSTRRSYGLACLCAFVCAMTMPGCASWLGTQPVIENNRVVEYNKLAAKVAQLDPSVQSDVPAPSLGPGRELLPPNPEDRWHLTLGEALRMGMQNNAVVRQNAQFMSPNNPILQSPDTVPSVYDPAIQNAGVIFGQRGVDAALSDFDPRLSWTFKSGDDQTPVNTVNLAPPNNILTNNYDQSQIKVEQQFLSGGILTLNQNLNYSLSNQPQQLFNSAYTGLLGAEFRQPLWAGAGTEYTEVAGPIAQRARGFSLVNQGIVIAHINRKLSEIDFLENLQNLAREIGDLYWDLYQNYQDYESENATSKVAKELWDRMTNREDIESGVEVAQAEDAYYESKSREEQALSNLFLTEAKLRRLLGLPIDDSRLIYPIDQPRDEELPFNRALCLYEALINRTELTRQKTNLHSLQLQLTAARKLVNPRLDFVGGYALNGLGNNLYSANTNFNPPAGSFGVNPNLPYNSALSNLYSARETSWSAGFEYSIPLWLRQEKAQVRQLELRIIKARAALAAQEDEIAHELNSVLMTIKRSYSMSRFSRKRLQAARKRVVAAESEYIAGSKSNDLFLRALTSKTQAQVAYARNIAEYNKALRDLLYRTGHLLNADGVQLLGVDGLPMLPPPSPANPLQPLPDPYDPEIPPSPKPREPGEQLKPKPGDVPPFAEVPPEKLSLLPKIFDEDDSRFAEDPQDAEEEADEKPQPRQALRMRKQYSRWDADADSNEEEIIPVSADDWDVPRR